MQNLANTLRYKIPAGMAMYAERPRTMWSFRHPIASIPLPGTAQPASESLSSATGMKRKREEPSTVEPVSVRRPNPEPIRPAKRPMSVKIRDDQTTGFEGDPSHPPLKTTATRPRQRRAELNTTSKHQHKPVELNTASECKRKPFKLTIIKNIDGKTFPDCATQTWGGTQSDIIEFLTDDGTRKDFDAGRLDLVIWSGDECKTSPFNYRSFMEAEIKRLEKKREDDLESQRRSMKTESEANERFLVNIKHPNAMRDLETKWSKHCQELQEKLTEANKKLAGAQEAITKGQAKVDRWEVEWEAYLAGKDATITELKRGQAALHEKVKSVEKGRQDLEAQLATSAQQKQKIHTELDQAKQEKEALKAQLLSPTQQKQMQAEIDRLTQENNALKAQLPSVTKQQEMRAEVKRLEQENATLKASREIGRLSGEVKRLEEDIAGLKASTAEGKKTSGQEEDATAEADIESNGDESTASDDNEPGPQAGLQYGNEPELYHEDEDTPLLDRPYEHPAPRFGQPSAPFAPRDSGYGGSVAPEEPMDIDKPMPAPSRISDARWEVPDVRLIDLLADMSPDEDGDPMALENENFRTLPSKNEVKRAKRQRALQQFIDEWRRSKAQRRGAGRVNAGTYNGVDGRAFNGVARGTLQPHRERPEPGFDQHRRDTGRHAGWRGGAPALRGRGAGTQREGRGGHQGPSRARGDLPAWRDRLQSLRDEDHYDADIDAEYRGGGPAWRGRGGGTPRRGGHHGHQGPTRARARVDVPAHRGGRDGNERPPWARDSLPAWRGGRRGNQGPLRARGDVPLRQGGRKVNQSQSRARDEDPEWRGGRPRTNMSNSAGANRHRPEPAVTESRAGPGTSRGRSGRDGRGGRGGGRSGRGGRVGRRRDERR
ncbi:hypothetical protein Tdes44962_MAKER05543 [Teratosphaeria destructans]|uniref:Uncharacterized protein n=1 Tax=Teratosphaeria destructans TaxID=418781 RepID=A0A9W7SK14_9PEZI|nr:hypothetical protein Tdes44962_MAKER05543 [Teratosphaeria destructans]